MMQHKNMVLLISLFECFFCNAMDLSQSIELKEVLVDEPTNESGSLRQSQGIDLLPYQPLTNSIELTDIENEKNAEYYLDQLKDALAYRDIDQANELIDEVALLKPIKKRNKILIQFQNFLSKQKTHIYPFIKNMKKWRGGITLASLAFALITYGCLLYLVFNNTGSLGANMPLIIAFLPLIFLLCLCSDSIKLHCTLHNAEEASIRNYNIYRIEKCLQKRISKLYHVKLNPEKHNAKKIILNVVNYFKKRQLHNAQNMIQNSVKKAQTES